jgi:hypothetical protein
MKTIKIKVHTIKMGDVEDPDLYVAEPIWNWQQTEAGKWIMENSKEQPMWNRSPDPYNYGHSYDIIAWLEEKDLTYWKLKYE